MSKLLVQARASGPASRSKVQAKFDRLLREIELLREQLQAWQQFEGHYRERVARDLQPQLALWRERRRDMVFLIDTLLSTPPVGRPLGKQQRAKLADLLQELAVSVLNESPQDDAELVAVFDRYSDVTHQELNDASFDMTRQMLAGLGVEVGDEPASAELGMDELLERASAQLFERMQQEEQQQREAAEAREAQRSAAGNQRTTAAQARKEQAEREVSQSIREIYRKLVSRLHPDRETDPQERARKTALMQRVNQAYEARDLLTLLTLQIEIEQISAADLATAPDKRIQHYNQVLTEQRDQLRDEVMGMAMRFEPLQPGLPGYSRAGTLTPQRLDAMLSADIEQLRGKIAAIERDLKNFRDRKYLGEWLKGVRPPPRQVEMDDFDEMATMMAMFEEMVGTMPPGARRPAKKR